MVAARRLLFQETTAGSSGHDEGVLVAKRHDRCPRLDALGRQRCASMMLYASYEMDLTSQLSRVKSQKKRSQEDGMQGGSFDPKTGVC